MENKFKITEINYKQTFSIRHTVMWPNKPLEYIKLPNDKIGKHYGLSVGQKLVSIISLFENRNKVQFRKFATLKEYQGIGYGTALLNYIIALAKEQECHKIWCNARVDKANFYLKFGLQKTTTRFTKEGIAYVIMEKTFGQKN